ncbi:MAG: (deoxy)nucleoside triphosphate pyrophosphohydrolase [Thermoanaerobaculales bacterium]|jgi:8-oxo-dGTP diphosphatase|nr:(deoxy)nucleoside triphosphate pyrophosphohydrolase [Thermoanaerobaculales bacterium]
MPAAAAPTLVVAAVIRDPEGRILLARRRDGVHMGGLWEFPGGKVETGEGPERALERELREELGIEASTGEPLTFAVHEEPGLRIVLLFFEARLGPEPPRPREGQEIAWVAPSELSAYPTPPADAELVRRLVEEAAG